MKEDPTLKRERFVRTGLRSTHIRFSYRQYEWLRSQAQEHDETLAGVVRRLVDRHRVHPKPVVSRDVVPGVSETSHVHKK